MKQPVELPFATEADAAPILDALRHRVPVILSGCHPSLVSCLKGFAQTAARNKCWCLLLGSWRFIPAVAAMKEVVNSGVLGPVESLRLQAQAPARNELDYLYASDLARWLQVAEVVFSASEEEALHLILEGKLGKIEVEATLDGSCASFVHSLGNAVHTRVIPVGNPAASEKAIAQRMPSLCFLL